MTPQFILSFLNQKGGVGKSTLSQNIAAAAHLAGYRTALFDLDPQATSFDWFAARKDTSKLSGLSVVRVDRDIPRRRLEEMMRPFEFVVCDGPARLAEICVSAAAASHIVVSPMRPGIGEWWAAEQTAKVFDTADGIRRDLDRAPLMRAYALNDVRPQVSETKGMADALVAMGAVVLSTMIQSRVVFDRARAEGESVLTFEPEGKAAGEVLALYNELLEMRVVHAAA